MAVQHATDSRTVKYECRLKRSSQHPPGIFCFRVWKWWSAPTEEDDVTSLAGLTLQTAEPAGLSAGPTAGLTAGLTIGPTDRLKAGLTAGPTAGFTAGPTVGPASAGTAG